MLVRPTQALEKCGLSKREKETVDENGADRILGVDDETDQEGQDDAEASGAEPEEAEDPLQRRRAYQPTPEETRQHRLTHMPYRDWCPECVAGAANDHPHMSRDPKIREALTVPEVHWDYCFPRDPEGGKGENAVVLVGRDRETKYTIAHVVPLKGASTEWVVEQVARDLMRLGIHGKVVLKSDQEPAIIDVLKEVARARGSNRTILEHSPVGDSSGNGIAERAIQAIEKLIRVHKLDLERRLKARVTVGHVIFPWLVEFCADLYNKHQVGRDGKTAYQRVKGKKFTQVLFPFAAPVMFRVCGKVKGSNMAERWFEGFFLGKKPHSEEFVIMRSNGQVVKARAVKEMAREVTLADLDRLIGEPHDPAGTLKGITRDEHRGEAGPRNADDLESGVPEFTPKRVLITRDVVLKFGPSKDCPKCRGVMSGDRSYQFVHHTEACRNRMEALMKEDEAFCRKVERADQRQTQRLAEMLERRERDGAQTRKRRLEKTTDTPSGPGG